MSNEKNPEVVGCDASIMMNVWEIRAREYDQKMILEQERLERSALPSINKDWAGRLAARLGGYKRVEQKPRKQLEIKTEDVWKSKTPMAPPSGVPPPRPVARPAPQSRSFSSPASSKEKKIPDKRVSRLQLLSSITQSQPSAMVWGKSWKYNKCLAAPTEDCTAGWGHCWMFATQQPFSEAGKPWPNGPNTMNPNNLHLWRKEDYRLVESEELDLTLPTEEWEMSWKKHVKAMKQDTSSGDGKNVSKYGFFTSLVESHCYNEECLPEWSDAWRATKPADQQEDVSAPHHESENVDKDMESGINSMWEECWRYVNYQGCNKIQSKPQKSINPKWGDSWKAAAVVSNNHIKSDASLGHDVSNDQQNKSFKKISPSVYQYKYKGQYEELCNEFKEFSEWSKSWQVTKNNSKPSEEIEKVLKASMASRETPVEVKNKENNVKVDHSESDQTAMLYKQLKHEVLYQPKGEFSQFKLFLLKYLEKTMPSADWRDSWKVIKHRMRMERRRMRPNPMRPFRESEKGGDMKPSASEWKDSWKCPQQSLSQEPEMWQQGWSTMTSIRMDRAREYDHFAPVERPKNGPSGEPAWEESWSFRRRQQRSQPGTPGQQNNHGRSDSMSHHHNTSRAQEGHASSTSDWQQAWMVSESQFHHDNPSLTQWRGAWRFCMSHEERRSEQMATNNWVDVKMEVRPMKETLQLQRATAKMSRSFDCQMFKQRYPEKEWSPSWKAGSLLTHQPGNQGSSGVQMGNRPQQQHGNDDGAKWGMSFRLANPMPQMEQHWENSCPNPRHYSIMWMKGKKMPVQLSPNFTNNPATFRVWINSHRFLQGANTQHNDKSKSHKNADPRVIVSMKEKSRKHLYSTFDKEKQSEKKWAGCHLLGKTQPRPKKGPSSGKKQQHEELGEDKFFEEWVESWKFYVSSNGLSKQKSFKPLKGWDNSWKFLFPMYPPMNGPKTR